MPQPVFGKMRKQGLGRARVREDGLQNGADHAEKPIVLASASGVQKSRVGYERRVEVVGDRGEIRGFPQQSSELDDSSGEGIGRILLGLCGRNRGCT